MSGALPEILVVDDEEQLLKVLGAALAASGFRPTTVASGRAALAALQSASFDAILLDLMLPDMDGKEVITTARTFCQTPIIVLSARTSEADKVEALDLGANDYLGKPFSIAELLARLRVATRPAALAMQRAQGVSIKFDFEGRRVCVAGRERRLTVRETEMLRVLHAAAGSVVPHKTLIEGVWGSDRDADLTHLRVLAWQVRRKIEPDASNPRFLLAEPGLGYRLNTSTET
jgi:two-component system KDP operon response regulator KdpE